MEFLANFSGLTLSILGIICLMSVWFAWPGYNSHSATHSPTILTSVGIFGTFLGVALGLLSFDTNDIQASVPGLIDGLKTAFWTSIAGLLGALAVKFRHLISILKQREVEEQYRSATITDLANLLGDIRDSLSKKEGEGLLASVANLQSGQEKHLTRLSDTMASYESRMIKANTNALIVSLKAVMKNFNTKINEQYGDNFKELNHAVGQMLQWQRTYKKELEELLLSQKSNGQLLDRASQAYEKMVGHTEVFNTVSDSLGTMLQGLKIQSDGLDKNLTQLAKVADQAATGLPQLEQRVEALTLQMASSVTDNQTQLSSLLTESAAAIKQTVESVNTTLSDSVTASQAGLQSKVEVMVERVEQQVMRLDDAMEEELVKALKTFGYQLTSLSEKFVSDYTPLTEKLQSVLQISANTDIKDVPNSVKAQVSGNNLQASHQASMLKNKSQQNTLLHNRSS